MDHNNDDGEEEEDPFRLLPDEQVLRILSFVTLADLSNSVSLVSKRFRRLSLDPSLWNELFFDGFGWSPLCFNPLYDEGTFRLIDRCTKLRSLTVICRDDVVEIVCRALEKNSDFDKLEEMEVEIPQCGHNEDEYDRDIGRMLKAIGSHGKALRTLYLRDNGKLNLGNDTTDCLGNLTSLHVSCLFRDDLDSVITTGLRFLSYDASPDVTDYDLGNLFSGLRNSLEGFRMPNGFCTDEAFMKIRKSESLTWLNLRFDAGMSGNTLETILDLPVLRTLIVKVGSTGSLTAEDYVIRGFGKAREKLEHLKLSDTKLGDLGLKAIAESCPNLISLSLKGCASLTDWSLSRLLGKCGKLRDLNLTGVKEVTSKSFEGVLAAPLERLAFAFAFADNQTISDVEKERILNLMPGLEICYEIRSYADQSRWWESRFSDFLHG